jgi:pimeloyl-ACP methyl ester carboxylesterase
LETQKICFDDSYAHYAQAGEKGPAVVILHGWAASMKQWKSLLPILAKAGFTAYAVDLPGHGQAPRLSDRYAIEDYLDYLGRWMRALDIRDPILLGHSMGGYLSLQYALDHTGTVRGLMLVNPLYDCRQLGDHHQLARRLLGGPEMLTVGKFVFRHAPVWLIEASHIWNRRDVGGVSAPLRRQIALDYKQADPHILQTILAVGDLRPHLHQVTVPTLVTWGCRDHLLSPDSFELLVDALPTAQGHCFADVGHHPHLICAQDFTELTLAFLHRIEYDSVPPEVSHLWTSSTIALPASR